MLPVSTAGDPDRLRPEPAIAPHPGPAIRIPIIPIVVLLSFALALAAAGCSNNAGPDPVPYPGVWRGYLGIADNKSGSTTLVIEGDLSSYVSGVIGGTMDAWGGLFEVRFEGDVTIQSTERLLGPITITRYRPGIDTLQANGTISGAFNLALAQILGSWGTIEGEPFGVSGSWGARKETR